MVQTNRSRELLRISVRLIRALGVACVTTALLSSLMLGLSELAWPMSRGARYTFTPAFPAQLWVFAALQALKPAGFIAGLFGLYLAATRRGFLLKVTFALAVAGGVFYAVVWIMIAVTGRDDAIYLGNRPIGSDAHTNGGMLFLWLLPIAVGTAALLPRRIPRWQAIWVILVGLIGSGLFGLFSLGLALITEGVLWVVLGLIVVNAAGNQPLHMAAAGSQTMAVDVRRRRSATDR
jgi:hypothetical protein